MFPEAHDTKKRLEGDGFGHTEQPHQLHLQQEGLPPEANRPRVLIAEDHQSIGETYKMMLELEGYDVTLSSDGQDCVEAFNHIFKLTCLCHGQAEDSHPFEVVILDYHLPRKDGIEIVKHIQSVAPHQRIIVASSYPREVILRAAGDLDQSVELMTKPFDLEQFADTVSKRRTTETIGGNNKTCSAGRFQEQLVQ